MKLTNPDERILYMAYHDTISDSITFAGPLPVASDDAMETYRYGRGPYDDGRVSVYIVDAVAKAAYDASHDKRDIIGNRLYLSYRVVHSTGDSETVAELYDDTLAEALDDLVHYLEYPMIRAAIWDRDLPDEYDDDGCMYEQWHKQQYDEIVEDIRERRGWVNPHDATDSYYVVACWHNGNGERIYYLSIDDLPYGEWSRNM